MLSSRVGEIWGANFNGYPVTGRVIYSDKQLVPSWKLWGSLCERNMETYHHHVQIIGSKRHVDVGQTHKWKESSKMPWNKRPDMKLLPSNQNWYNRIDTSLIRIDANYHPRPIETPTPTLFERALCGIGFHKKRLMRTRTYEQGKQTEYDCVFCKNYKHVDWDIWDC